MKFSGHLPTSFLAMPKKILEIWRRFQKSGQSLNQMEVSMFYQMVKKYLILQNWQGEQKMTILKNWQGEQIGFGVFFKNLPKKVPYVKKNFICDISATLTKYNQSQYLQPSRKENWGSISGLLQDLLILKDVSNSVGHAVQRVET